MTIVFEQMERFSVWQQGEFWLHQDGLWYGWEYIGEEVVFNGLTFLQMYNLYLTTNETKPKEEKEDFSS